MWNVVTIVVDAVWINEKIIQINKSMESWERISIVLWCFRKKKVFKKVIYGNFILNKEKKAILSKNVIVDAAHLFKLKKINDFWIFWKKLSSKNLS